MKTERSRSLGRMRTFVVGGEYCHAAELPGEKLTFVREPRNRHDANAVRAENAGGDKLGYLPRDVAAWLAPLLDREMITILGRPENWCPTLANAPRWPAEVEVRLLAAGRPIIQAASRPTTAAAMLHELVRRAFTMVARSNDPAAAQAVRRALDSAAGGDVLPETRLLLALLPWQAEKGNAAQRRGVMKQARAFLAALALGEPSHYHGLSLFPLTATDGGNADYVLLEAAIAAGTAEVTEVGDGGSVPELMVHNRGDRPLLIANGDILVGAKQDRVVNITIIIAAKSSVRIPVNCVERGRWREVSRTFDVEFSAPSTLRAAHARNVTRERVAAGRADGDQYETWSSVDRALADLNVPSQTSSMSDAFRAHHDDLETYRKHLRLPDDASGFIAARGGRIVGMDVFDAPATLQHAWPRLSQGYFIDALCRDLADATPKPDEATAFLGRVSRALRIAPATAGAGVELEVSGADLSGSGVWFNDRLCHLSAFALAAEKEG